MARLVTLLPEPDSPTSPSAPPASSSRLTPFTACTTFRPLSKRTARSRTRSTASPAAVRVAVRAHSCSPPMLPRSRGSIQSRRPSPSRLKPSTVRASAIPANVDHHQAVWM